MSKLLLIAESKFSRMINRVLASRENGTIFSGRANLALALV
jgi:hypothetical protein